jgi:hypothetical protein
MITRKRWPILISLPAEKEINMKVDQILELGKLGFTKNEIMGIMNAQNMSGLGQIPPQQIPPQQIPPQQIPPQQNPTGLGQDATSAALMTAINTLTATLQAGNLSASGKTGTTQRTSDNVAEDLMKLMN